MPTFSTDIEFEVFCAECGAGICNHADTRVSHRRNANQVVVRPCDTCMKAKQDEIDGHEETIEQRDSTIEDLREEVAALKEQLAEKEKATA